MEYPEIKSYFDQHKRAMHYLAASSDDYLGARVCFLNLLVKQGYIFSAQAIEKLLKANILLLQSSVDFRIRKEFPSHDLTSLLDRLILVSGKDLTKYQGLCKVLTETYPVFRYPSDDHFRNLSERSFSNGLIHELDEIYIQLYIDLPIPIQVKVRNSLLGYLKISRFTEVISHIIKNNKAYTKNIDFFSHPLEWYMDPGTAPLPNTAIKM